MRQDGRWAVGRRLYLVIDSAWVIHIIPCTGHAHVAQSVEHFLGKEEVAGSIPAVGSLLSSPEEATFRLRTSS